MNEKTVPPAGGICAECLKTGIAWREDALNVAATAYCEHNLTGGFLVSSADGLVWKLMTPVSSREAWERNANVGIGKGQALRDRVLNDALKDTPPGGTA